MKNNSRWPSTSLRVEFTSRSKFRSRRPHHEHGTDEGKEFSSLITASHRSIRFRLSQLWEVRRCILLRRFFYSSFWRAAAPVSSRSFPVLYQSPVIGWFIFFLSPPCACIDERKMGSHVTSLCSFTRPTMDVVLRRVSHKRRVKRNPQRSCSELFRFNLRFRFSVGWLLHYREATKRIYIKTEK